ncbi:histidine kinase [Actinokineospora auranticolor]|uniref:sensor histidine kinase n=1 Tax=Actinokineospora auranticolor TaxID=155976 RepID=UPI000CEC5911|nr:histidine kinase [Actinokineospora auranticolor]
MLNTAVALRRQAWLVAAVCVVADVGFLVMGCPNLFVGWRGWAAIAVTVAADLLLAGPARYAGAVALVHGLAEALTPVVWQLDFGGPNQVGVLVAGYRAGAWLGTREALFALAFVATGLATARFFYGTDWRLSVLHILATGLLPWLVGRNTTARRGYIAGLEHLATRRAAEEREAVRRAVARERTDIARDLHDVISHHVSAINIHAGAARLALPVDESRPDTVRVSLTAVESASRAAMADLRRLLDVLHRGEESTQPGLADLDDLVAVVREAGLPTRVVTSGDLATVPQSVDIALYRVTQEALTNALRHGHGGSATLTIDRTPAEITLSVTNDITRSASNGATGHRGLTGIRHRTAMFGGRTDCGPNPDGLKWTVKVSIPLEAN